jgi:hypothetical protein
MSTTTLRAYLSHEYQDLAVISRQIYDDLGIPIRPDRLGRVLANNYPDVEISDGILIRIKAPEISHATPPKPVREHEQHQRRRA